MEKIIEQIELAAQPPGTEACFDLICEIVPEAPFALFGGAVRDAHYSATYPQEPPRINDYDIRVWLPEDDHEVHTKEFVQRLGAFSGSEVEYRPSAGTGRIRYYLTWEGIELDISVRKPEIVVPSNSTSLAVARVALERAGESDAGLSSVAIAPDRTAWAMPEFQRDVTDRTITMYPRPNSGTRLPEYAERMQRKFPGHRVVWL
jgi:hypothetical protein